MQNVFHANHRADYDAGRNAAIADIGAHGAAKAARKWADENPVGAQPSSLGAYYYAKGGLEAHVEARK